MTSDAKPEPDRKISLMEIQNWLQDIPTSLPEELVENVLTHRNLRIEKIISIGHRSDQGFWYDQIENEWVMILTGKACLRIESEQEPRQLSKGDSLHIPAGVRHRIEWTTPDEPTIWIAIFYAE